MRARYKIQKEPYTGTGKDDYNSTPDSWGEPVDVFIYGANFENTSEPTAAGKNRVVREGVLLVPKSFSSNPRDRFILPGEPGKYEAIGIPETAKRNPLAGGWNPGGKLKVRRVSG